MEFVEKRPGSGVSGEDATDRGQREGAEADGAIESGTHVVARVAGGQGQQVLSLQLALDLFGEQTVEKRQAHRTEFREALSQQSRSFLGIAGWVMALD